MKIPIKIPPDSAKIITSWILDPKSTKKSKHLLRDRIDRLKAIAKKPLLNQEDIEKFFVSFITNSTAYFSNTNINRNFILTNIDNSLAIIISSELFKLNAQAIEIEKSITPYKIPLCLLSKDTKPYNVNTNIYVYCVKGKYSVKPLTPILVPLIVDSSTR